MEQEVGWAGAVEISEVDIAMIASLYNDCVAKIDPFRFKLDMRGDFTLKPWCKDIISLIRLMKKIGAKPRLYLQSQIVEYRKPHSSGRQVPTIKMMTTPAGIDRYARFCDRMGMNKVDVHMLTKKELEDFSKIQMNSVMKRLNLNEIMFFQDPYLVSQLSRTFVESHPIFKDLVRTGYYKETESIFP